MSRQECGELGARMRWDWRYKRENIYKKKLERAHQDFLKREAQEAKQKAINEEKRKQAQQDAIARLNDELSTH